MPFRCGVRYFELTHLFNAHAHCPIYAAFGREDETPVHPGYKILLQEKQSTDSPSHESVTVPTIESSTTGELSTSCHN